MPVLRRRLREQQQQKLCLPKSLQEKWSPETLFIVAPNWYECRCLLMRCQRHKRVNYWFIQHHRWTFETIVLNKRNQRITFFHLCDIPEQSIFIYDDRKTVHFWLVGRENVRSCKAGTIAPIIPARGGQGRTLGTCCSSRWDQGQPELQNETVSKKKFFCRVFFEITEIFHILIRVLLTWCMLLSKLSEMYVFDLSKLYLI